MALNFPGSAGSYLTNTGYAGGAGGSDPLSISFWFRCDQNTTFDVLVNPRAGASQFIVYARGDVAGDPIECTVGGSSAARTTTGYTAGQWHHGCAIWASTTDRRCFIDGGGKGTNTASSAMGTITDMLVGVRSDGLAVLDGAMAEIASYNIALSDDEVLALARGHSPLQVRRDALTDYWPLFGQTTGGSGRNLINSAANFTLNGSVGIAEHPPKIIYYPRKRLIVPVATNTGVGLALTKTLDAVTLSSDVDISGYMLSRTLDAVTSTGDVDILAQLNLTRTLGAVTSSSDVDVVAGLSLAKTLDAITLSSDVAIGGAVGLDLSITLDAVTSSSTLAVQVGLALSKTLDAVTSSSDLAILVQLNSSQTLGAVTLSSDLVIGNAPLGLELSKTLDAVTSSSTLGILVQLSLNKTLDPITASSTLQMEVGLSLAKTLEAVTSSSDLDILVQLSSTKTLDAVTLSSTLNIISGVVLNLDKTLQAVTLSSTLALDIQLNLTSTIGGVSLSSELLTGTPVELQGGGYLKSASKIKREKDLEMDDLEVLGLVLGMDKLAEFLE